MSLIKNLFGDYNSESKETKNQIIMRFINRLEKFSMETKISSITQSMMPKILIYFEFNFYLFIDIENAIRKKGHKKALNFQKKKKAEFFFR